MTARLIPDPSRGRKQDPQLPQPAGAQERDGWRYFSYMIGGMVFYGGVGWLIGRWTGIPILFGLGMVFGIVLSVLMIIFRFTRS
jgi:ATP synthase protein I